MTETHMRTPAEIMADARAERDRLIQENQAGFAEIARMGAQVDPSGILTARIDILARLTLGDDTPAYVEFQIRFERMVAEQLEEIRGQVRQARLAAGPPLPPQTLREMQQMAQGSGLLGPNGQPLR